MSREGNIYITQESNIEERTIHVANAVLNHAMINEQVYTGNLFDETLQSHIKPQKCGDNIIHKQR